MHAAHKQRPKKSTCHRSLAYSRYSPEIMLTGETHQWPKHHLPNSYWKINSRNVDSHRHRAIPSRITVLSVNDMCRLLSGTTDEDNAPFPCFSGLNHKVVREKCGHTCFTPRNAIFEILAFVHYMIKKWWKVVFLWNTQKQIRVHTNYIDRLWKPWITHCRERIKTNWNKIRY